MYRRLAISEFLLNVVVAVYQFFSRPAPPSIQRDRFL
jgi:hypothetical protein